MGQAKCRGTFEQQKARAIELNSYYRKEARKIEIAIEAARTPEERKKRAALRMKLASYYGIARWW